MIGEELKERRQRLGLAPQDLARLLGVKDDTVTGWESGRVRIPRSVRLRVFLGNLQRKHGEILRGGEGFRAWEQWLDERIEMGPAGLDPLDSGDVKVPKWLGS